MIPSSTATNMAHALTGLASDATRNCWFVGPTRSRTTAPCMIAAATLSTGQAAVRSRTPIAAGVTSGEVA